MPLIQVGDIRIYYEIEGSGEPVVLLGGGLLGRHNFPPVVFEELRKHFMVISFDQRGYGKSDRPLEKYTLDLWTDDIAKLLNELRVHRSHVFGTSVGGVLALKFAAKYPEKTIACVSDVPIVKPDTLRRIMFGNWRRFAQAVGLGELYADMILTYNVGAKILETPEGPKIRQSLVELLAGIPVETVVQVCIAMENLDLREVSSQNKSSDSGHVHRRRHGQSAGHGRLGNRRETSCRVGAPRHFENLEGNRPRGYDRNS